MKKLLNRIWHKIQALLTRLRQKIVTMPYRDIALKIVKFIGDLMHRALFTVLLPKRFRTLTKQQIYTIIFKSDTPAGKKFDIWLLALIAINIVVIMLESLSTAAPWFTITMRILGWGFTILFTFEYYLRVYCLKKPWKYLLSFYGIIDFFSIFPAYLSLFIPAASTLSVLRLMRILRIFRIFKMQRFLDESHFLLNAIKRSAVKILIFMLFVFIMAIILGATMYGIEGDKNPQISSIPRGIYWAVVTITTVGYGDISPVTPMGQFVSMIVMLLGYSIIAVPTGIVAGETLEEHKRTRLLGPARRLHRDEETTDNSLAPAPQEVPSADSDTTDTAEASSEEPLPYRPTPRNRETDPGARIRPEDLM